MGDSGWMRGRATRARGRATRARGQATWARGRATRCGGGPRRGRGGPGAGGSTGRSGGGRPSPWGPGARRGRADVTYVATGNRGADDPDWAARGAAHRARRPAWWRTAETTDLAGLLARARGALLIDGIGTWLAAVLDECGWDPRDDAARDQVAARQAELVSAWRQARGYVV